MLAAFAVLLSVLVLDLLYETSFRLIIFVWFNKFVVLLRSSVELFLLYGILTTGL
jgi:hypothetical protein